MISLGRAFVIIFGTGLALSVLLVILILGPQGPGMIGFIITMLAVVTTFVNTVGMDVGWWLAVALLLAAFYFQFAEPPDRPLTQGTVSQLEGDDVT